MSKINFFYNFPLRGFSLFSLKQKIDLDCFNSTTIFPSSYLLLPISSCFFGIFTFNLSHFWSRFCNRKTKLYTVVTCWYREKKQVSLRIWPLSLLQKRYVPLTNWKVFYGSWVGKYFRIYRWKEFKIYQEVWLPYLVLKSFSVMYGRKKSLFRFLKNAVISLYHCWYISWW